MEDLDRVNAAAAHEARQLADLAAIGDRLGRRRRPPERALRPLRRRHRRAAARAASPTSATARAARSGEAAPRAARDVPTAPTRDVPGPASEARAGGAAVRGALRRCACAPATSRSPSSTRWPAAHRHASTTSCCAATTACRPTTSPSSSTTPPRASTTVVRGDDLLASTPRQVHLQRLLGLPTPQYVHVPARGRRRRPAPGQAPRRRDARPTWRAEGVPARRRRARSRSRSAAERPGPRRPARRLRPGAVAAVGRSPVALADLQRSWS